MWICHTGYMYEARCRLCLCLKDIDISKMGEIALKSYARNEKHKQLVENWSSVSVSSFVSGNANTRMTACPSQSNTDTNNQTLITGQIESTSSQSTLATGTDTLSAEVLWALRVCRPLTQKNKKDSENVQI